MSYYIEIRQFLVGVLLVFPAMHKAHKFCHLMPKIHRVTKYNPNTLVRHTQKPHSPITLKLTVKRREIGKQHFK